MRYIARILQKENGFSAEFIKGITIEFQRSGYLGQQNAVYALNQFIADYNVKHCLKIPLLTQHKLSVEWHSTEPEAEMPDIQPSQKAKPSVKVKQAVETQPNVANIEPKPPACQPPQFKKTSAAIQDNPAAQPTAEALQDKALETAIQDNLEKKSRKLPRKPFTPYGLNGYQVDKQGNVRLMLDRRANACTIVLEPTMFNALAEMVRKTQEQHNDPNI